MERAPQGAPPTAPETRFASRRPTQVSTPLTRIVPHRELHLRRHEEGSHGVLPPISAHPSHRSRSTGSSTDGPRRRVRMAPPRTCRHTPDEDRAPQGAPPIAPMGNFAWRPDPHFGARLTRIALHREHHPRPQWARSRGGHPLHGDRAPHLRARSPQQPPIRSHTHTHIQIY